jgi:uncharacterized membrane protein
MPMQATTTTPLFSAALRPDRSPRIVGGWVAYVVAALATAPFSILIPGVLVPALAAFVIGGAVMVTLTMMQSRQERLTQQVTLWPDQLEVATSTGREATILRRFDPKTVRLLLDRDANEKATAVRLRSGAEELELGGFLKAEDRASFARAFGTALRRARQAS